ncbi:WD repeat-containing protein 47 isoform X1 [Maniola jurtina]|uniref:WD repeat-containing protein 47 isoform X1 n=2 Tax=Maniola jurtina TaxID=191418 RepID=UPI001E68EE4B|nr:WD repeat-containing protein 47 isoform X1 [Maniola jurtina]XP_045783965.1 WD repeat-containing protein 47 isoform X1 [Maniola jurtina]
MPPILHLNLGEEDVVKLMLEFLHTRQLHITQLSLERETGVVNGNYSNDVLYLRQLILDGQWDDVLVYIQPLTALKAFEVERFNYAILRHKFIELLCMKSEVRAFDNVEDIVKDVVKVLEQLEKLAPSKEEYAKLCLLLTLPTITEDAEYKQWNPSNARVQCFFEVLPLVEQFLPSEKKTSSGALKSAKNDRLIQLMIKGLLYETCMNYCHAKASGTKEPDLNEMDFLQLLDVPPFNEKDLSLLSWLESIPSETFKITFDQRKLDVAVEKLVRPSLHTSWTEHMLVTPIKPRTYPHLSMPFKRPRSAADAMTRSLRPLPDGAPKHPDLMALSAMYYGPSTSFHLPSSSSNAINAPVDNLSDSTTDEHNTAFITLNEKLQPIKETEKSGEKNIDTSIGASAVTTPERRPQRQLWLAPPLATSSPVSIAAATSIAVSPKQDVVQSVQNEFRRDLLTEYQQKKQIECEEYLRVLCSSEYRPQQPLDPVGPEQSNTAFKLNSPMPSEIDVVNPIIPPRFEDVRTPRKTPPKRESEEDEFISEGFSPMRRLHPRERILSVSPNMPKALRNAQSAQKNMPKPVSSMAEVDSSKPTFKPITMLEDLQAVRCAEFHPNGKLYAVGSNTKTLRICTYPKMDEINWDDVKEGASPPTVLLKRTKHHKGSIYCLAWSPAGDLLATASNDKTVKLMRFNSHTCNLEGQEMELSMHDGTVRDICFIEDTSNKASLLVSGGAGDCKIYVTDCATGKPFQSLAGHSGHVLSLYNWGGAMFVSGSQDKTVRFWDLRVGGCVNVIPNKSSAVTSLAVESSGRLLVSGYEDGFCSMHDVRAARPLQRFGLHSSDVRSVRFSPGAYYLLTAGYDGLVVLTDVQGDLTSPLPSVLVARHSDKVISSRWHPEDFSFLSTSADKTAVLWTIPPV